MSLRDRIGIDVGGRLPVVDAVEWARDKDVHYVDVSLEDRLAEGFGDDEAAAIRDVCRDGDVTLGLHTSSAVNMAEHGPFVDDATDEYLLGYVDAANRLGAAHVVVHGGYHFSGDVDDRFEASLARLERAAERAADRDVTLLLENHNPEPDDAEVHYVPAAPEECEWYFDRLPADVVGWAFNPPHANLHPVGIEGFADALDLGRCGEVRLNDNRGTHEEHLPPGEGSIDFGATFELVERTGYDGHYALAWGTLDDMLDGREYLLEVAGAG